MTVQGRTLRKYLLEERGASAAEFALIVIPTVGLFMTSLCMSLLLWTSSSLHWAVEEAARCYALGATHANTTACTDAASTINYATSKYSGPSYAPAFAANTNGCGHTVTGTITFPLNTGLINVSVPINASSCYP